jgi:futalosine hydrolase
MSNLLLIPTEQELRFLRPRLQSLLRPGSPDTDWQVELCGFGLVAAAARTAMLLAQLRPRQVLLLGIAGSLSQRAAVGSAWEFNRVIGQGIGVGSGERHLSDAAVGWNHWPGCELTSPIGDTIDLTTGAGGCGDAASTATLLSVCAASADPPEALHRRHAYPDAIAEDMEGFAVALACSLFAVPLRIIRGISNLAGDRDLKHWQIQEAMEAVAQRATQLMATSVEASR